MKYKKLISFLLCLIMLLSVLIPCNIYAAEGDKVGEEDKQDEFVVDTELAENEQQQQQEQQQQFDNNNTANDIICDNADLQSFADLSSGTIQNGGYNGEFIKTISAKYTCKVTDNGVYKLYVYNPKADFTASGTLVVVKGAVDTTSHTVDLTNKDENSWIEIGTFEFSNKQDVEIILKGISGNEIKADAVKICYVSHDFTFDPEQVGGHDYLKSSDKYGDYYKTLIGLGIYNSEQNDFKIGEHIERGRAAQIVAKMLGMKEETKQSTVYFADVPVGSQYCSSVNFLAESGVILGDGARFRPEDALTLKETLFLILRALGYDYQGRLPNFEEQYYTYASNIQLITGVSAKPDDKITAEDLTRIIYNALDLAIVVRDGDNYKPSKDKNLLNTYLDAKKGKGIIQDNGITDLSGMTCTDRLHCVIGDEIYESTYAMTGEMLGRQVEYYSTEDNEILYAFQTKNNNITRIAAVDLETADSQYTKNNIVYTEGNRKKHINIPQNVFVVYNGEALLSYDTNDFKINEGDITCIDNDNDSKVDVVVIRNVQYCAVEKSYPDRNKFSAYNTDDVYDFQENGCEGVFVNSKNQEISLTDISDGNVIAYIESKSGKVKIGYLLDAAPISASVTSISSDSVAFGGISYDFSKAYQSTISVTAGNAVTAYLTWDNTVFYMQNKGAGAEKYGYLIKMIYDENTEECSIKLLNTDGEIITVPVAERKIAFNGKSKSLSQIHEEIKGKPQLIKYAMNGKGEVSLLKTAYDTTSEPDYEGYDPTRFTMDYVNEEARYVGTYSSFNGINSLSSATLIFQVPYPAGTHTSDNDYYGIIDVKKIKHYEIYDVKCYDFDEAYNIGAITIYSEESAMSTELEAANEPVIVTGQVEALGDDDEVKGGIEGYKSGTKTTYLYNTDKIIENTTENWANMNAIKGPNGETQTYAGVKITDLKFGDIVQFSTDAKGIVTGMRVLYRPSYHTPEMGGENMYIDTLHPLNSDNCYAALYAGYGTVTAIKGNWIYYKVKAADGSGNMWLRKCSTSGQYYFMELNGNKLSPATKNDLCVGDNILMRGYYGIPKEMIILED